jgi:hypothetical protein
VVVAVCRRRRCGSLLVVVGFLRSRHHRGDGLSRCGFAGAGLRWWSGLLFVVVVVVVVVMAWVIVSRFAGVVLSWWWWWWRLRFVAVAVKVVAWVRYDHLFFLSLPAPLPLLSPPSFLLLRAHIPLERGGAAVPVLASEGAKASLIKPTSLNRGEGLIAELTCKVGGVEGEGKGKVVVEE